VAGNLFARLVPRHTEAGTVGRILEIDLDENRGFSCVLSIPSLPEVI